MAATMGTATESEVTAEGKSRWNEERLVREGIVSVRELSQHTTQVLRAIERRGRPILVTRHSKIVATMAPITMRTIVDRIVANDADLRNSMTLAEQALEDDKVRSLREIDSDDDD